MKIEMGRGKGLFRLRKIAAENDLTVKKMEIIWGGGLIIVFYF